MSLASAGIGGGAGLTGLSHTAGYNQLQTTQVVHDDAQDYSEINAKPIAPSGVELTTDEYGVRNKHGAPMEKYPHISIDLFGDTKDIVYHAPLIISRAQAQAQNEGNLLVCLGQHVDENICIKRTEQSYKIFKKFLRSDCSEELYQQVLDHCLTTTTEEELTDACVIKTPYLLLGARRIELVNEVTSSKYSIIQSSKTSSAIEPLVDKNESNVESNVYIRNQTLGGSNIINNNDYDRVAFQIHILDNKKPLFVLPEEIVSLQLAKVRKIVQDDMKVRFSYEEEKGISFLDYPIGLPVPSYIMTDALSEAVLDACNVLNTEYSLTTKELHNHRCLSAINGEIIRIFNGTSDGNKLLTTVRKYFPKQKEKEEESVDSLPIIHYIGVTQNGIEGVSFQISADLTYIKCLSETGYQCNDPYSKVEKVLKDLKSSVSKLVPKKYRKPTAIITYGSLSTQIKLHTQLKEMIGNEDSSFHSWKKATLISSKEEVTAYGACVLATQVDIDMSDVIKDIDVKPVSNTCVGVRINKEAIKVIFDFDRRVPAGPYKLDLSAAEFVAKEQLQKEEVNQKEIDKYAGKKFIPQRESMAKGLKVQVYQKVERDGVWIPVGDVLKPLVKVEKKEDDEEEVVACESSTLQLSLSVNGVLSAAVVGDFESVEQALENSRYTTIRYYGILTTVITLCVYFFIKSYWEEHTNNRDVKRLLHYYKIAAKNSFYDGDNWNARYVIWKYRGRRHVLWRRLEAKYGIAVPETWDEEEEEKEDGDIDLDEMDEKDGDKEKEEF